MAKQRRNYTREFKVEAVRRIAAEGKSLAEIARELGLGESLLRSWKTALADEGEQAFPGKGHLPAVEEELRRLRAENQRLRIEREILKQPPQQNLWVRFGSGSCPRLCNKASLATLAVRNPYDFLVTSFTLLFRPSTAPDEIAPRARNQFKISG